MSRTPVVTGMSVLHALGDETETLSGVLRRGTGRRRLDLHAFNVREWAARHLAHDPDAARRLARAAGRSALPARTAACVATKALRHAGLHPTAIAETMLIVAGNNLALGYHADAWDGFDNGDGRARAGHMLDHLDTDAVGAVSEAVGLRREGWALGGASASGSLAVIQASRFITAGITDRCLVVAPVCDLSELEVQAFSLSGAMTDPGRTCRPFDVARSGFVYGPAAAAVVLETRELAGERALAAVAGYGTRLDGHRGAEPDSEGQAYAMRAALDRAGLRPDDVGLVNAHATGSVRGDQSEADALCAVFDRDGPWVNSSKAHLGHGLTAAGLVELIGSVVQLRERFAHGNPHTRHPIDAPLRFVGTKSVVADDLSVVLSNSFAFSGINASIALTREDVAA